tara:strand:+ start:10313 stop:10579 length:267 start_codon:yes stop_codon:yes gene_type:complete
MNSISSKDIRALVRLIYENLTIPVFAGKGDSKRILIKPGLKIKHKKSGLLYTVVNVYPEDDILMIQCIRPPDTRITISSDNLEEYERQ